LATFKIVVLGINLLLSLIHQMLNLGFLAWDFWGTLNNLGGSSNPLQDSYILVFHNTPSLKPNGGHKSKLAVTPFGQNF